MNSWPMFEFGPRGKDGKRLGPFQMRWHISYPFLRPYKWRFRTLIFGAHSRKWDEYDAKHRIDRKAMGEHNAFWFWWRVEVRK